MLFHTAAFAGFFAVAWVLYWVARSVRTRNRLLVAASAVFYGAWDVRFLALLAASVLVDFECARRCERAREPGHRRALLFTSLAFNLGVLAFFKYLGFFVDSLAELVTSVGLAWDPAVPRIALPVGISFYTFQTMSYTIDVYRGRTRASTDPVAFAAYVTFFPQLVAGPIERADRLLPQLLAPRPAEVGDAAGSAPMSLLRFAWRDQLEGASIFAVGLYLKVVVADNLAPVVERIYGAAPAELWGTDVVLGTYAFAFQIWGDFAGYSTMAIGLARCLGITLSDNFRAPYLSASPQELWQRWHVTLSSWLRDYLYVPLGGNRHGPWRTRFNLLATMVLGGLWHGAAWHFVAWGAFHGLWLAVHRSLRGRLGSAAILRPFAILLTFHLTCVGWVFFRADDMHHAWSLLARLGTFAWELEHAAMATTLAHFAWAGMVIQIVKDRVPGVLRGEGGRPLLHVLAAYALVHVILEGVFGDVRQFIYFQF